MDSAKGDDMRERYSDKAKRDARARELVGQGFRVRRSSSRNQQLHPMYVKDCNDEANRDARTNWLTQNMGFGNAAYKTTFDVIYTVEWERK